MVTPKNNTESFIKIEKTVLPEINDCEHLRKRMKEIYISEHLLFLLK